MFDLFGDIGAYFSSDRKYRYSLYRWWDHSKSQIMFIGLNPSTADETNDDPTIRRCIRFAKDWGYGGIIMTNLFAFRATDPRIMKSYIDPIGIDNNHWLLELSKICEITVAAWGNHGSFKNRDKEIYNIISNLYCLGISKEGQPKHPLYLRADTKLIKYEVRNNGK